MAHHHLRATPTTVHWGHLDADLEPVLEIDRGDVVRMDSVSGGRDRLPPDRSEHPVLEDHLAILEACTPDLGPHILTGPIAVRGADIGDLLLVDILSVDLRQNWGWNEICPGDGALPELEDRTEVMTIPIDLRQREILLPWGERMKAHPFFGIMAVQPPDGTGRVTSVIPGVFGGNMDVRHLGEGATLCFPVHQRGGGFSAGDGHALQGDGEVVGTAVETSLAGTFRFDVERGAAFLPFPFAELDGRFLTMAFDEDLDLAATCAIRQAIDILESRYGLSRREGYRHTSLCGNLAISQMVNKKKGVHLSVDVTPLGPCRPRQRRDESIDPSVAPIP